MILYPAIDIRGGRAVRLAQGDYDRETALRRRSASTPRSAGPGGGAAFLHVVDLDGARDGRAARTSTHVRRIAAAVGLPGPGRRRAARRGVGRGRARAGAERVVIGTAALRDPEFLEAMLAEHGDRVVVSVDARGGEVALAGWTESSEAEVAEAVGRARRPRRRRASSSRRSRSTGRWRARGSRSSRAVAAATRRRRSSTPAVSATSPTCGRSPPAGARRTSSGVIVGRALYEGRFTVAEAKQALAKRDLRRRE